MPTAVVLLPSTTYRASDFIRAAEGLGVDLVVASENPPPFDMGDRYLQVDCSDPGDAAEAIVALGDRFPIDGVVAADDAGVVAAAIAGERLGVAANSPEAAAASRDKKMQRALLAAAEVPQPRFSVVPRGESAEPAAAMIGYLPENGPLYNEMTPASLLDYVGKARGMSGTRLRERLDFVSEACALRGVWHKAIGKLSRGYRQRVGMAQALLHDPDVLILDEPTGGLDPNQVQGVRELIHRLRETKTLLLSTHILREVRAMCDRVIVINNGRIVFDGAADGMGSDDAEMEARFRSLTAA